METDPEQIAEAFDRDYIDPATVRLKVEHGRLQAVRREAEALVSRKREIAEKMRATIAEIEENS